MQRVKQNDQVVVLSGKDRGKRGKVLRLSLESGRAVVEGLGMNKKHMRRSQTNPEGAIISRESPLPLDRVQPVCPRCNRGVRIGFQIADDGTKSRICRRCKETF